MRPFSAGRFGGQAIAPWLVLLAALTLNACGDTRKALGFEKTSPDEFKIVNRAPLSLPPDYALRPPQPGAARPQELSVPEQARQVVIGTAAPARSVAPAGASTGEAALLSKVGATRSDPRIRETVNREAVTLAEADRTFLDRLIFWRKPDEQGSVIDAQREAQRLRENQALGRPVTDGDTPIIRRRKKGALEGLF